MYFQVFGNEGILRALKPVSGATVDPRLYDITVEHLLRHSAGWDQAKGPVYDPMLNQLYIEKGHPVSDISKTMNVQGILSQVGK